MYYLRIKPPKILFEVHLTADLVLGADIAHTFKTEIEKNKWELESAVPMESCFKVKVRLWPNEQIEFLVFLGKFCEANKIKFCDYSK